MKAMARTAAMVATIFLLAGCATQRIDWQSRVGVYTYDQAVTDYGPPDKSAKLSDGSTVAEWLTRRGQVIETAQPAFYPPGYWGPAWSGYSSTYMPAHFLRLTFDPGGRLKSWKEFSK